MSISIYLTPEKPVSLLDFEEFAEQNEIVYSPRTVGQNVYYCHGIEVIVSGKGNSEKPQPPESIESISLSMTFFHCDPAKLVSLADKVAQRFNATAEVDSALEPAWDNFQALEKSRIEAANSQ